ncbi:MAG: beta-galactosidase trimerization domain-containing protein [Clostridia bacterium]|nr:beta-galactosidase trimerization domain-containing protein [Clostridia bacterium]
MKKRKDSFFGIHFDFHAKPGQVVGEIYRPEYAAELLDRVKPDFVQCDTKGHYGLSSYPTKIGYQADEIHHDVLAMWRRLTAERDIALYGHHSGLYDIKAAQMHPDWAIKDADGKVSDRYMSPFGPYADQLLIPQLTELAVDYELNGAWIDGECWGAMVDYSDNAVNAYKAKYGKQPPMPGDGDYENYREFCRQGFRDYVKKYVTAIKAVKPDFEITSNWIYSAYMPEAVTTEVDFLSGDYDPVNSVESARHQSRCLAARNMTWDLMAWGQNARPITFATDDRCTKEYEQYCQEAAGVISLGGGFQFFNIMYGGGGLVQQWAIPMWQRVAAFCREREFCHKSKPIPQIGIIYPMETSDLSEQELYTTTYKSRRAMFCWNNALLDCGYSTQVIYQSEPGDLSRFPLIVLPYGEHIDDNFAYFLKQYVKNGGRLIVDLPCSKYFADICDGGQLQRDALLFAQGGNALGAIVCDYRKLNGTHTANVYTANYFESECMPGAVIHKIGKGNITFMCVDFATAYETNISSALKNFIKDTISSTGFEPMVTVNGSSLVQIALMEKDEKTHINLLNNAGQSAIENVRAYGEVPKIGPLDIDVKCCKQPKSVIQLPESREIEYTCSSGSIHFEIPTLHIHTAVIIEF